MDLSEATQGKPGGQYELLSELFIQTMAIAMPNLEAIHRQAPYPVTEAFFEGISRCSARQITLSGLKINPSLALRLPNQWPIQSLDLNVTEHRDLQPSTATFTTSSEPSR